MAFVQPEAINRIQMQPMQKAERWLGNIDALVARERARLALDGGPVTPGSGPKPGDTNGGLSGGCAGGCAGCGGGCK